MNDTREIVTLQFGNFANYVGAHYWNIQVMNDSLSSNTSHMCIISFRNIRLITIQIHRMCQKSTMTFFFGRHNKTVTFTPRMLLVDLKGSLKYIKESGNLYTENQIEMNNPENKVLDQVRGTFE